MGKHKNKIKKEAEELKEELVYAYDNGGEVENPEDVQSVSTTPNKSEKKKKKNKQAAQVTEKLPAAAHLESYEYYKNLMETDENSGLVEVTEKRHLALPFHVAGKLTEAVDYIATRSLMKYRKSARGVVFGVGECRRLGQARILDDQMVFHSDYAVKQIVFRPRLGKKYEARVLQISHDFFSALLHETLQVKGRIDKAARARLGGHSLKAGDRVLVRCTGLDVKGGMCSIVANLLKVTYKEEGQAAMVEEQNVSRKRKHEQQLSDDLFALQGNEENGADENEHEENGLNESVVLEGEEPAHKRLKTNDGEIETSSEKKKRKKDKELKLRSIKEEPLDHTRQEEVTENGMNDADQTPQINKDKKKKKEKERTVDLKTPKQEPTSAQKKNRFADFSDDE